jgi:hypothetical protein
MWWSFPCIRIPNRLAEECADWITWDASHREMYRYYVDSGKHDDYFWMEFLMAKHRNVRVLNLAPALVDHIDYLIGGSVINRDRGRPETRTAFWEDHTVITELEEKLKNTDYDELKEQAKKAAVEFEGLKELYTEKIKEFEESRESKEEAFAKEAALKRNNLDEEIQANRSENQDRVTNSVRAFTGSYMYYMDQIRLLMDALNQAATETGKTLFASEVEDVKECFGARIAEHLRKDVGELKQGTGDRLLISGANEERIVARIKP